MTPETSGRTLLCLEALEAFFSGREPVLEWGVTPVVLPNAANLRAWVQEGRHGVMEYMAERLSERENPRTRHAWAESAVVFAFPYDNPLGRAGAPYKVASYARLSDYHAVGKGLLRAAEAHLRATPGLEDVRFYGFTDTAPVFERDLASEAGLGWRGKNCCTLNRTHGSGFHLSGFFLDVPMAAPAPAEDFCGGCTRCLDACPTGAFTGPGKLDATKCISYWTIEAKGAVPENLSKDFGGWIFGCDVCQEVCPWNHKPMRSTGRPGPAPAAAGPAAANPASAGTEASSGAWPADGQAWFDLLRKGGGFRSRFKRSPLMRAGRRTLMRNLAIAARNLNDTSLLESLRGVLGEETDPSVRAEIERAIAHLERPTP
jgi:epoxyqueuosine reductase